MEMETLYIKAEMCTIVTNRKIFLRDVVKLYGTDKKIVKELNEVINTLPTEKSGSNYGRFNCWNSGSEIGILRNVQPFLQRKWKRI